MLIESLLLILIEDLEVGAGYHLDACVFHTKEELCLLSTVALARFFLALADM